jgi:hypothetical protein
MSSIDPLPALLSPEGVAVRQEASSPSAPVRLGLLLNPRAGQLGPRRDRDRLVGLLPERAVETPDLGALRRALARLLAQARVNVLAIAGGDGTVHHAVNALLHLEQESEAATGRSAPLPRLLLLNGGTLNIVGRTVGIHGRPQGTLRRFLDYFAGAPLSRVPARRLPVLEVRRGDGLPRYGFVFGSEAAYHAIRLYVRFGAGYAGLARFIFELARGIHKGSRLWQEEGWKLGPYHHELRVDGHRHCPYTGVAATTVDLTLAIGAVRAIRRPLHAQGFFAKVVTETDPLRILGLVPALMSERSPPGVVDYPGAREMHLFGPYTLDGECFDEPAVAAERLPLHVLASAHRLFAVPGELGAEDW